MNEKDKRIKELEAQVAELKGMLKASDALKKHDIQGVYNDIASSLVGYYADYVDTQSIEMDVGLGEVYREQLGQVYKILRKKGVDFQKHWPYPLG